MTQLQVYFATFALARGSAGFWGKTNLRSFKVGVGSLLWSYFCLCQGILKKLGANMGGRGAMMEKRRNPLKLLLFEGPREIGTILLLFGGNKMGSEVVN